MAVGSTASETSQSGIQPVSNNRCRREGDSQKPARSKPVQGISLWLRKFTLISQDAHLGQPLPRLQRSRTSSFHARLRCILRKRSETCGSEISQEVGP